MAEIRLQKWLSQLGLTSRRNAEVWIEKGRLSVDGEVATLGKKVDPQSQEIRLDGELLPQTPPKKSYWMICKPIEVITSRSDPEGRETVFDLPVIQNQGDSLYTVGRLDYYTEGLLLLSNDGELVHRLMHPSYKVPRKYYVLIAEPLTPMKASKIRNGIELEDGLTLPAELKEVENLPVKRTEAWYEITVREGRNRLVRRLFEAVGSPVNRLIRFGFGDIRLDSDLPPGEGRRLTTEEILHLRKVTQLL